MVPQERHSRLKKEMKRHNELEAHIPKIPKKLKNQDNISLQIEVTFTGIGGENLVRQIFKVFHVSIREENRIGNPNRIKELIHQIKHKFVFLILSYLTTIFIQIIYQHETLNSDMLSKIVFYSLLIILIPIHKDIHKCLFPPEDSN